jgi:hypothetical protein
VSDARPWSDALEAARQRAVDDARVFQRELPEWGDGADVYDSMARIAKQLDSLVKTLEGAPAGVWRFLEVAMLRDHDLGDILGRRVIALVQDHRREDFTQELRKLADAAGEFVSVRERPRRGSGLNFRDYLIDRMIEVYAAGGGDLSGINGWGDAVENDPDTAHPLVLFINATLDELQFDALGLTYLRKLIGTRIREIPEIHVP